MKKKIAFVSSFALATLLVVGQFTYAKQDDMTKNDSNMNGMMNNSSMMNNDGMMKMMNAMNSPEGQKMMDACGNFMDSQKTDKAD